MSSTVTEKVDDGIYGHAYIELMDANPESRRTREAFQQAALSLIKPGSTIVDFGSGPGVDAKCNAAKMKTSRRVALGDVPASAMTIAYKTPLARGPQLFHSSDAYQALRASQGRPFAGPDEQHSHT